MSENPFLIAVAPNGARKTKKEHSALPLTTVELIETAETCLAAGAAMMHFHVRDSSGQHTLDHTIYGPVLKELEAVVGEKMLLQVSSESVGMYQPAEQIEQMKRLAPHCLSLGLREIIRDHRDFSDGHKFLSELHRTGVLVQYILYSPEDVEWYEKLCGEGIISGKNHLLLLVLGQYGQTGDEGKQLVHYVDAIKSKSPWMVCGFGKREHSLMAEAVQRGGHARVGFENNHLLPDGSPALDNASLVKLTANEALSKGRSLGDKTFAELLYDNNEDN